MGFLGSFRASFEQFAVTCFPWKWCHCHDQMCAWTQAPPALWIVGGVRSNRQKLEMTCFPWQGRNFQNFEQVGNDVVSMEMTRQPKNSNSYPPHIETNYWNEWSEKQKYLTITMRVPNDHFNECCSIYNRGFRCSSCSFRRHHQINFYSTVHEFLGFEGS